MVKRALFSAAALALLACSSERVARTEIMLVVDSDLEVPDELDELEFVVEGPDGTRQDALAVLEEGPLPRSLGLVHTRGPLEPLDVQVNGLLAGEVVVTRRATLGFVAGKTLVLPLHLTRSCIDMECDDGTCAEGRCVDIELDARELDDWTGEEPRLEEPAEPPEDAGTSDASDEADAGASRDAGGDSTSDARVDGGGDAGRRDGGQCGAATETCNQRDDDCDGEIDEDFSLSDDARNCGSCGNVCGGASRMCCEGSCRRGCF